ncbi:hypothetical protein QTP70_003894 [Hemibagrus guttatus]|uniref:TIR domain-containing protein n=1 Tax=Hemibagrus guttatus TaxID=175788 RepID=A0AAE0UTF2_9TELE|nr:hypothetical protein QTP70_003894 [Hemibagrus guttatus]
MTIRASFILPLLQIWICLLVAESTSKCFIKDDEAYCVLRKLDEVPVLPPNITYLDLSLNAISEIHEKSFHGLEKLQILMIQQQEVRLVLRNNAFSGLSNLIKLDLAYNTNLRVDPGAFNGLFNLQILNLTECKLYDSILSGDYLRPLVSLEQISLAGNNIRKIRPASFFTNMSKLHVVDISHNWINSFCEEDLFHFQGKHFTLLKLHDIKMSDMNPYWGSWNKCGNPFKNMSMTVLDLSLNGFSVDMAVLFFRAIRGTKIHSLILNHSGSMGKGVWYDNTKDPDRDTFMDLAESGIKALDLSKASIFTLKNAVFSYMPDLEEISLAESTSKCFIKDDEAYCVLRKLDEVPVLPPNITYLDLTLNYISEIHEKSFHGLEKLQILMIQQQEVRLVLRNNAFSGLSNLIKLDLAYNKNLRVDPGAFNGLFNLQILNLTECKLYDSILSGDYLRPLVSLEQLSLAGNNIRKIRPASFFTNMSKLHVVDISHNWINSFCEEDLFHFQEELMCEFPEMQQGKPLLHAKLCEDVEDEKMIEKLKLTLFICCTMLIILNTTGPITFVRLHGYCFKFYRKVIVRFVDGGPKVAANDDFMYDVYLCFSSKDIKWVTKALLEKLDTQFSDQNELRCCFEARDFIPGEDHLSNIYNAIWKSKKTLFILSREFFKDGWCLEAFSLAQTKMLEELQDVSLVLLVDNIPHYKLMKYELFRTYFQTRRHLCWPEDYQDLEWFYSHLKQSILKDTKVKRKSLSMKGRPSSFILPLLQIWICLLVEESTSKCFIKDDKAYCALRKLDEVPVLPPNITYLDLTLNYISEIHEKSFHGLEKLQILMIQQQEVRLVLRNNAFSGLSNLIKLDLAYNTNLRVDPGAFNGLFNLQILNLTECKLYDSILSGDYLRPLVSLEQLSLAGNNIRKIRPASFFADMSKLHVVDISHNWINSFCEEDLFHFQGKHFTLLKLHDIKMSDMNPYWGSWNKCGNPFKNMSMTVLDLSLNGFSVDMAVLFFRAIRGTKIHILILNHSGSMEREFEELMCEFPEMQQGKPLLHAKLCEDVEDEKMIEKLKLTLFICCTMLIILNTTGPITFVRLHGYCFKFYRKVIVRFVDGGPKVAANDDFMYDVYLCFSSKDIKWVTKALLEKLDTQFSDQNELRCCFEARDFIPGEDHLSNMRNAIWKSKKTLFILSREFFKDGWCLEAFSLAQTKMQKEVQDVSLVLLVDNIPHYRLMKYEPVRTYFQTRRHLCWPEDYQDLEWFYSHLKQSILKDTKVKRKVKIDVDVETNHKEKNCEAVTAL